MAILTVSGSSGDSTFFFFRGVEVLLKAMTTILRGGQKQLLWVMIQYICLPLPISMLASLCGRYDKKSEIEACGAYYINVGTYRQLIVETLAVGLYILNFKTVPNVHLYRSLSLRPIAEPFPIAMIPLPVSIYGFL